MKISVVIKNRLKSLTFKLDTQRRICRVDGLIYDVDVEDLAFNICAYVNKWPKELKNDLILDGENYKVEIENEGVKDCFVGKNAFPENYNEFKRFILDVKKNKIVDNI